MQVIADLQLHSRFSRAVSPQMTIPNIAAWAARKGIGLAATGDWTHPMWFREIQQNLEEMGNGLLRLRPGDASSEEGSSFTVYPSVPGAFFPSAIFKKNMTVPEKTRPPTPPPMFLLATEVSCIYKQGDKTRRIHTLVWVPSIDSASKIAKEMTKRGCNLLSDGRPIIGLTSIQLAELVLTIEPRALIIPAHAWTPWFSVYGKMGGFDSIEQAFGPFAKYIYAVETGLSSSPSMNWRIKELDNRSIVSFSDAHSGPKLGREATVFEMPELNYKNISQAIQKTQNTQSVRQSDASDVQKLRISESSGPRIAYTIEFYPEEGKYHYTGHRTCHVRFGPAEAKIKGMTCSVCGKSLTQGVMQRVEELAGRSEEDLNITSNGYRVASVEKSVKMIGSKMFPDRPPFVMLVPLQEILSEAIGSPVTSPKVQILYQKLTEHLDGEFSVLLRSSATEIADIAGDQVAEGIEKVRKGDIVIDPGYDGVFGVVKIWGKGSLAEKSKEQLTMF